MTAHNCAEVTLCGPKRRGRVGTKVARVPDTVPHGVMREGGRRRTSFVRISLAVTRIF